MYYEDSLSPRTPNRRSRSFDIELSRIVVLILNPLSFFNYFQRRVLFVFSDSLIPPLSVATSNRDSSGVCRTNYCGERDVRGFLALSLAN